MPLERKAMTPTITIDRRGGDAAIMDKEAWDTHIWKIAMAAMGAFNVLLRELPAESIRTVLEVEIPDATLREWAKRWIGPPIACPEKEGTNELKMA